MKNKTIGIWKAAPATLTGERTAPAVREGEATQGGHTRLMQLLRSPGWLQCAGAQWRRPQGQSLVSGAEDWVLRIWRWSKETTSLEMVGPHSVGKGRVPGPAGGARLTLASW
jgi:hypothetical protein